MKSEDIRSFLTQRRVVFKEKKIDYGIQFRCQEGETFSVYDTGKVVPGGKKTELTQAIMEMGQQGTPRTAVQESIKGKAELSREVFIVYGHDIIARDNLELLLRRMGLEPIVLQNLTAAGDTVIEKLERYLGEHGNVGFACVLLTPDDEGHKASHPNEKKYRPRQNVVLELGMVLARLGRHRVAILHKGSVELPSDISGLIYIAFAERVDEVKAKLFRELQDAGYNPSPEAL